MKKTYFFILFFYCFQLYSQKDTIKLDEVVVSTNRSPMLYSETSRIVSIIDREIIENSPSQSLQDILEYALNVDVRQRGNNGVQADISIRGGSFNQTLILLNGVKVNDPQTGHHNLNLPIDLNDIQRIEILEGAGSRVFGANAMTGAINIITGNNKNRNVKFSASAGENGFYKASSSINIEKNKSKHFLSFSRKKSDGYRENTDFNIINFFYQNKTNLKIGKINFSAGYSSKDFGALNFYTSDYPNQFEATKTKFASLELKNGKDKIKTTTKIYWRRHNDRFELYREGEEWYQRVDDFFIKGTDTAATWYSGHNYHRSDVYGAETNLSFSSFLGVTSFGLELRSENVLSNVLGDNMLSQDVPNEEFGKFTKSKSRNNLGIFFEHNIFLGNFAASGGVFTNYNSNFGASNCLGLDMSYKIFENLKIFTSYNQSLRLPTYTELFYKTGTHQSNPDLKPEKSTSIEFGAKANYKVFNYNISIFQRYGKDIISWIRKKDTKISSITNIPEVNSRGLEMSLNISPKKLNIDFINYIFINYSYLKMTKKDDEKEDIISNYALDHLKNKITFGIENKIWRKINSSIRINYQDRENFYDFKSNEEKSYNDFYTVDFRLFLSKNIFNYYVEVSNLFNVKYYDFHQVQREGRWIRFGVNSTIDF